MMEASEVDPQRINAKEVLTTQKGEEFIFPVADDTAKSSVSDCEFREPTPRREQTARSEDLSGELQGEPEEPQPTALPTTIHTSPQHHDREQARSETVDATSQRHTTTLVFVLNRAKCFKKVCWNGRSDSDSAS